MANRADLLNACFFGNRWVTSQSPNAGTTLVAQSPVTDSNSRPHLETLWYSIKNMVGAGAIISTVTVQVRNASAAGTIFASNDHLVAPSTSANVQLVGAGIPGKRGSRFYITMNTVIASVSQSLTAAGWVEDTNG